MTIVDITGQHVLDMEARLLEGGATSEEVSEAWAVFEDLLEETFGAKHWRAYNAKIARHLTNSPIYREIIKLRVCLGGNGINADYAWHALHPPPKNSDITSEEPPASVIPAFYYVRPR